MANEKLLQALNKDLGLIGKKLNRQELIELADGLVGYFSTLVKMQTRINQIEIKEKPPVAGELVEPEAENNNNY